MSQSAGSGYADLKQCKLRLQISDSIVAADEKIQAFMREADSYINTQVNLFATTPIKNPDDELKMLSSSLAAALYNYFQSPQAPMEGVKEYKKAIGDHIRANYYKETDTGLSADTISKTASAINGTET